MIIHEYWRGDAGMSRRKPKETLHDYSFTKYPTPSTYSNEKNVIINSYLTSTLLLATVVVA